MKKFLSVILVTLMLTSLTGCEPLEIPQYENYYVKCEITGYNETECRETTIFLHPDGTIFSRKGYHGEIGDFYSVEFIRKVEDSLVTE